MGFELIPDDDETARTPSKHGTRVGGSQAKVKAENPWKGRFDRRKSAREEPVDFPNADSNEDTSDTPDKKA